MSPSLTPSELSRYSRHIMLPEMGVEGQQALKAASVLIVGAGGLGSPLCLYLAAAGIGTLGIIDNDTVDETNLQRQILYNMDDIGLSKVDCATSRLRKLNPYINIQPYHTALSSQNALDIIQPYDLVIDGTDNFPTRYLVNDACVLLNKPNVYGSIFRFEGQATVFNYSKGPCYRCLYPAPPPPGLVPSCAEGGVLGILPAIIASIQATEAIKIITGIGTTLTGRLLIYEALDMKFDELTIVRDQHCCLCGEQPTIKGLTNYQQFCGIADTPIDVTYGEIASQELKTLIDTNTAPTIIDVREPYEREICHIEGSQHIPMQQISNHLQEFDPNQELLFYCKLGGRSAKVCQLFTDNGYQRVTNLKGGIMAWANEIDTTLTQY
ncbi:MAG: molybdenum cofactor biosynthesis protein MoeB [Moraxellaceae bacterium]|nr:MAG: molybdenum cofactor biosynthesis protein MoeB [Moraxellaceae bacterium]